MTAEFNKNTCFHGLTLLKHCGGGAYGDVYYCRDISGRYMAVKIVDKQKFGESWERELKGVINYRKITETHSALMQIYHVSEDEKTFYYTMEPADSSDPAEYKPDTLSRRLDRGAIPAADQYGIISGIFEGIRIIHEAGFAHRDIKPDNIIFVNGHPKLGDIGLMSSLASTMTTFAGTLEFVPPEQRGNHTDDKSSRQKSDFYAFGKVIYCMITGCTPDKFPDIPPDIPMTPNLQFFLRLVFRLCDRDPLRRIASIEETAGELERIEFKLRYGETVKDRIFLLLKDSGLFLRVMGQHIALGVKKHCLLVSGALLFAALTGYAVWHHLFNRSGSDDKLLSFGDPPEKFKELNFCGDLYSLHIPVTWQIYQRSGIIRDLKKKYSDPVTQRMQLKAFRHLQALLRPDNTASYIQISCMPLRIKDLDSLPEKDLPAVLKPFFSSDITFLSVKKIPPRNGHGISFMVIGSFAPDGHLVSWLFPQEHHCVEFVLNQRGNPPDREDFVQFITMMEYFKVNGTISETYTMDPDGRTPFMLAVADYNFKQAERLLSEGAKVDESAYGGSTALHLAVEDRSLDSLRFLIRNKAALHAADNLKMTPLILAARDGLPEIMAELLKAGADTEQRDFRNYTALCHAVSESHPACVRLLLDSGANPDITVHPVLKTPLIMLAAAQKDPEVLKILIEHKIDLRAVNGQNENALLRVLNIAVTDKEASKITMAAMLIRAGIDINHADERGLTALMYAASLGNMDLIQLLLKRGADKKQQDRAGRMASAYCDGQKYPEIKKILSEL